VKTLIDARITSGKHTVKWDGTNFAGTHVVGGVYLYKLEADDFSATSKMLLLK
jgi:flagellar hook assembly protein FlgD